MLTLDFKVIAHKVSGDEKKGAYTVTLRCVQARDCMDYVEVYVNSLDGLQLGFSLRANFYEEVAQEDK